MVSLKTQDIPPSPNIHLEIDNHIHVFKNIFKEIFYQLLVRHVLTIAEAESVVSSCSGAHSEIFQNLEDMEE